MFRTARKNENRGFTLSELMIAFAIASMVLGSVLYFFMQRMQTWNRGEKAMILQAETSKILGAVYTDLKRVNPVIFYDQNFDLWVSGEKYKEAKPNVVELIDENDKRSDGFERIKFNVYMVEPFSKHETIQYYLKSDQNSVGNYLKNSKGTAYILVKSVNGTETVVSENVESFKINRYPGDPRTVNVGVGIKMPPEYDVVKKSDSFDLVVRFDGDYIVLKETLPNR